MSVAATTPQMKATKRKTSGRPLLEQHELQSLLTRAVDSLLSSDLPGLAALFRVSSIGFSANPKNPTLRMWFNPRTGTGKIEIDRQFATDYLETPPKMAAALAHELLHHLFRHFVLYPSDLMTNLAQDILINALIFRVAPGFQQLFNSMYEKTEFPGMVLRPGANLKRIENNDIREIVAGFQKKLYRKASRALQMTYFEDPKRDPDVLTIEDLATVLQQVANLQDQIMDANLKAKRDEMFGLKGMNRDWYGRPPELPEDDTRRLLLLGHHVDPNELDEDDVADQFSTEGLDESNADDFQEILDGLIGDLSCNPNAANLFKKSFRLDQDEAPDALIDAFNAALREDIMRMQEIVETIVGPKPNLTSVVPLHLGRKEIFLLSQGILPFFYPAFGPDEEPNGGDVAVYIDVSGSMGDWAQFLVMLMTQFKHRIATEFYQFSTQIAEINFAEFIETFESTGKISVDTTGGTDFSPIFYHAKERGHEKILLISDGCAGVNEEMTAFAESIETYTVFTPRSQLEPLTSVSRQTWTMPDIKIKPKVIAE